MTCCAGWATRRHETRDVVKKSTSPIPEFKLQMCPTGSISTTNVQQRQQYAVSTSLLNLRNQLSLVSALEQLHPGLG